MAVLHNSLEMAFFTLIDSRAQVKGSRDPLGIQGIWSALGRKIVGNLTTVSTSLPDFTALILGYWIVEQLADTGSEVDVFLRWEQMAAYCRIYEGGSDASVRGVERVKSRLSEGPRVTISAEREHQILGNQKTYGLWGLYSMPSRASGLLDPHGGRLTPKTRDFVEQAILPKFGTIIGKGGRGLVDRLAKFRFKLDLAGDDRQLAKAIREVLVTNGPSAMPSGELEFYREHLLFGGPDGERVQALAVETMPEMKDREDLINPQVLRDWSGSAVKRDPELAEHLDFIRITESLLAPCSRLFSFLLGQDGREIASVGADVAAKWDGAFVSLETEALRAVVPALAPDWLDVAQAMEAADYVKVIEHLRQVNVRIMGERGGAPWFSIERGKVRVHYFEAPGALPDRKDLSSLWVHSYFLDSLAAMSLQLSP